METKIKTATEIRAEIKARMAEQRAKFQARLNKIKNKPKTPEQLAEIEQKKLKAEAKAAMDEYNLKVFLGTVTTKDDQDKNAKVAEINEKLNIEKGKVK